MSSTIDDRGERGQILVIFAASLLVIFGIAALVFDGGMMLLEKRDQQNAADASALAGARFLPGNQDKANGRALAVAAANGYTAGAGDVKVDVSFPTANRVRVTIANTRPSFFAGIFGMDSFDVASSALATNESRPSGPFALLSLNESLCVA